MMVDDSLNASIIKIGNNNIVRYSNSLVRRALEEIEAKNSVPIHSIIINERENDLSASDWYQKGKNAAMKEDDDNAIHYYQKAIDLDSRYTEAYISIGTPYERKGNYDEAIKCYQKAILLNPQDWFPYFSMGYAYERQGNYDQAIESYEKVLEIDRRSGGNFIYYRIGFSYLNKGNKDKAIEWYRIGAKLGHPTTQEWLKENGYDW